AQSLAGKSPQIAYGKRSKILARIFTRMLSRCRLLTSDFYPAATRAASHRAVRRRRASPARGPTSCTPIGKPFAASRSGKLIAGMPHNVHNVQNDGSPVEARPDRKSVV